MPDARQPSPSGTAPSRDTEVQQGTLDEGVIAFSATQPDVEAAVSPGGDRGKVRREPDRVTGRPRGLARVTLAATRSSAGKRPGPATNVTWRIANRLCI